MPVHDVLFSSASFRAEHKFEGVILSKIADSHNYWGVFLNYNFFKVLSVIQVHTHS